MRARTCLRATHRQAQTGLSVFVAELLLFSYFFEISFRGFSSLTHYIHIEVSIFRQDRQDDQDIT